MKKESFIGVATVIFTIVGLVHVYRAFNGLSFNVMGWDVPVTLSWIGGLFALFMAYSGYKLRK